MCVQRGCAPERYRVCLERLRGCSKLDCSHALRNSAANWLATTTPTPVLHHFLLFFAQSAADRLLEGTAGHSLAHQPCHPSLKAAVCWRYAQLLTALPNRAAEAEAWASAGRKLLAESGGQGFGAGVAIQDVLGDVAALKGQGQHGRGAIVSLMARRLLPVFG